MEVIPPVIRVAVIGFGHRGQHITDLLCSSHKEFVVKFIYEPYASLDFDMILKKYPDVCITTLWDDAYDNDVDLAIITTVNNDHFEWLARFIPRKTKIFCEKPIITNESQLSACLRVARGDVDIFSGFVLRHAGFYQKIKDIISSKKIGAIIQINAEESLHYGHGAFINQDWRRFSETSGGHIVEKGVHMIDLMIWFIGSQVVSVFAQGENRFWTPENGNVNRTWMVERDPHIFQQYKAHGIDPFDSEKDIPATVVSTMQFEDKTLAVLTLNTCAPNSTRRFTLTGTRGSITAHWEENKGEITVLYQGVGKKESSGHPSKRSVYTFDNIGCHGGGDQHIVDELAKYVKNEQRADPSWKEALVSTATAIAMEESMKKNQVIQVTRF